MENDYRKGDGRERKGSAVSRPKRQKEKKERHEGIWGIRCFFSCHKKGRDQPLPVSNSLLKRKTLDVLRDTVKQDGSPNAVSIPAYKQGGRKKKKLQSKSKVGHAGPRKNGGRSLCFMPNRPVRSPKNPESPQGVMLPASKKGGRDVEHQFRKGKEKNAKR